MKPQSSKAKGRKFQQIVRDAILEAFPNLAPDDVRSTSMGASGEDIQLSPAARKLLPFQIECKSKATSQIHTYMEQAIAHGPYEPIVIVKKDRSYPVAVIKFDFFLKLIQELNDYRKTKNTN